MYRGIYPFYKIGTICSSMATSNSSRLTPEERLSYLSNRRLGGPQNRSRRCGEVKNLSSAGFGTPDCQSRSISHYTESLFNLLDLERAFVQLLLAVACTFSIQYTRSLIKPERPTPCSQQLAICLCP